MIKLNSKIYVAGHTGLVGSAILRKLKQKGYKNVFTISRKKLDLKDQNKVFRYLKKIKPDFIFIDAAKVGGIYSNSNFKADFIYDLTESKLILNNIKIDNLSNKALEDLLDQYNKGNKNLLNKVIFRNFVKKFFQTYAG